jgi:3-deoxy-7-phosphoheptulonate synthase
MLITLETCSDVTHVEDTLKGLGLWTQRVDSPGGPPALLVDPSSRRIEPGLIAAVAGVARVMVAKSTHPKVDALAHQTVALNARELGPHMPPLLFAGPCSVESPEQIHAAAAMAAAAGATLLRGGAFKPRTSPYSFNGHGRHALQWMREAADAHGLGIVTEVMSEHEVASVAETADLIQIGSRNMQNFALLQQVGAMGKPVMLKRGMAARVSEWLMAGEHVLAAGASHVVFCERGIVGFDPQTRNLLDLGAVALLRHTYGQTVVVDPSHAAGRRDLVVPLARAALAAGACGLLVEAHPAPEEARSDGPQALTHEEMKQLGAIMKHPSIVNRMAS